MTLFTLLRLAMALGGYAYCCGEECHAQPPTPAHTITRGADGLERVGVDFNTMPCMRQAEPSCYVVSVRQTGEGASTITWPRVTLAEKGQCIVAAVSQDTKGVAHKWGLHLKHLGTEKGMARFEMRMYGNSRVYYADQKVAFGKETTVALGGDTPEPLCVGLRVESKPAPFTSCNAPVPPTAALTAATPATWATPVNYPAGYQMPAPMPVSMPVPVAKPMPAPMPVPPPMTAPFNPTPYPTYDRLHAVYPMPPSMPLVYPQPYVGPPLHMITPPMPTVMPVTHAAPVMTKTVCLVKEDGRSKVMMHGPAGATRAVKMTVEEGVCGKMHLCAGAKHVHVSGHAWKAQADKVEVCADGRVVLHGHVKLMCEKLGDGVSVSGDKVCFRVKGGHFVELMAK